MFNYGVWRRVKKKIWIILYSKLLLHEEKWSESASGPSEPERYGTHPMTQQQSWHFEQSAVYKDE